MLMKKFYPYDPNSTERITETATIEDAIVLLNHIPKKDSIQIDGFNETSSINLTANQFRCDYSLNTQYREANRILHFNSENDGRTISISYIVVGSPILADTMNEIKDHLENSTLHGSAYTLPTASTETKGGVIIGKGLSMDGDTLNASCEDKSIFKFNAPYAPPEIDIDFLSIPVENNVDVNAKTWSTDSTSDESPEVSFVAIVGRPAKFGDIIYWSHTSNRNGWAIRADDKWINLGIDGESDTRWSAINPLLTIEDREKLDNFSSDLILGTTPSTVEGAMWLSV